MIGLTARQGELLRFIRDFRREHGWMPTMNQMALALGLQGRGNVIRLLHVLEERGHIVRHGKSYRLRVVPAWEHREIADCDCVLCAELRRTEYLELLARALHNDPPRNLSTIRRTNFIVPSRARRLELAGQVEVNAAPRMRPAVPTEAR